MTEQYASADPSTFVKRGFMTGREITLAGVRAVSRATRSGDSSRSGIQFLFEEKGRDGERRIISGFAHMGAWGDQLVPSENGKGLSPAKGADKPFVEAESELGFFNAALLAAGFPKKEMTGNYQKYVGTVLVLEEKTLPSFRRKKSVDPDDAAPVKEYKTEVPSKIVTLPSDNDGYKGLTEKEITAHLKERQDKIDARRSAASDADAPETSTDEEETPAPVKKAKKAPKVEEPEEDSFEDGDDEEEETPAAEESDDEEEEEDEEENPANTLAAKLILKVLKAEKKVKGSQLLQKVHPLLAGTDKKVTAAVLKLVQSPKFIAAVDGVTVKGNMVVLG